MLGSNRLVKDSVVEKKPCWWMEWVLGWNPPGSGEDFDGSVVVGTYYDFVVEAPVVVGAV